MLLRTFAHYGVHFILPLIIALFFYRKQWKMVYVICLLAMVIDLDHLLATPVFDPNRCSINFHPLHTYYAIEGYMIFLFFKKTRVLGIALLIHIFADVVDCCLM